MVLDKRLKKSLPSESDFKQGLYMFDVGQNDLDDAFNSRSEDQVVALIPGIISEFESGLKVICLQLKKKFRNKILGRKFTFFKKNLILHC